MATNESAMYDMLSEEDLVGLGPAAKESGSVHSFAEALNLLDRYPWYRLLALDVHPEYLDEVVRAVAERSDPITAARWLLKFAGSVAVLTGAGVSAESGIRHSAATVAIADTPLQDLARLKVSPRSKLVWTWYEERRRTIALARPNDGHYAICRIEERSPFSR